MRRSLPHEASPRHRQRVRHRGVDEAASAPLGGLDAVVAAAGVAGSGTVAETPVDEWERVFASTRVTST